MDFTDLTAQDLIAQRDAYLQDCMTLESEGGSDGDLDDRRRMIDEIHAELARREEEGEALVEEPADIPLEAPDFVARTRARIARLEDLARRAEEAERFGDAAACLEAAYRMDKDLSTTG